MAAKFPQDFENNVRCPICLSQFEDPRVLFPCLHSYCRKCLEQLLDKRKSSIVCPECRDVTKVKDVSSLRVNIWINKNLSLLEQFNAEKNQDGYPQLMCNNCDRNEPAKARCFNCEKYMCCDCVDAHKRMSVLRDHILLDLKDINASSSIPVTEKLTLCDKHKGEKQKLFCEDCKLLICRDCTLIDHKDHDFKFIEEVIEEHKKELQGEINSAKKTEQKIASALNTVKGMEERVRKNYEHVERKIDAAIDAAIQTLERQRTALKQESRNMTALKMKRLSPQKHDLEMHSAALKSAVDFIKNLLKNGNTSDILSMVEQLTSRMSALSVKDIDDEVDEDDQVELKINKEKPRDDPGFLRLEDPGAPDPTRCCLKWVRNGGAGLDVKNCNGSLISIKKNRIHVNCPFDANVRILSFQGLPQSSRNCFFDLNDITQHRIMGLFRDYRPALDYDSGRLESGDLEVFIDGKPIKGSPLKVYEL